ncbi:suppressor of fused domain protein [Pedobacter sp. MR22-3]|uniref:suppressor of fused domain protein n=1 Tax=Pedobacter sp. MR22-3 TaxID=2994552 RepID=UPI00224544AB|nr:suppressor of fused domain protein [Pedobacter sp. MR22-3]MCX2584178.1 suppressor of fused domain protein [Pedobacter sp. MR22-3]
MSETIDNNKQIAKYIAPILGINPTARRHWDEENKKSIDIFTVIDPLHTNIQFHGTLGVSEAQLKINNEIQNFSLELIIGADKEFTDTPNILATCGFYIIKDHWECKPGAVFMDMVKMYYDSLEMKHIYFNVPFVWDDKLKPLQLPDKKIVWLLAIPISDKELKYKTENGDKALQELFKKHQIDVFDLNRKSIV